jgi:hypothetical protein
LAKARQVWITGIKTVESEKKKYIIMDQKKIFGVKPPCFISWLIGKPVVLKNGAHFSVGSRGPIGAYCPAIIQWSFEKLGL